MSPHRQPDSHPPSPDSGGTPREIGRERTNLLSRTKAARGRGFTPTCTARKAIKATLPWYRRAGKPVCRDALDAEWLSIVKRLLE